VIINCSFHAGHVFMTANPRSLSPSRWFANFHGEN